MCGIAGVLAADGTSPIDRTRVDRMRDSLAHRGPDAAASWTDPGIALTHRRLAIIDLATGNQPVANETGSVRAVLNGEIYNYRELRAWLRSRGHRFSSSGDAEVLVHLYEEDGADCIARLRGMFALAIWDGAERRLLLARDRVGLKPLYIHRDATRLVFASEVRALLAYGDIERTVDPGALETYLGYGAVLGPSSIFRDVQRLPAAHVLQVSAGTLDALPRRYWQLHYDPQPGVPAAVWGERIRAAIDESMRLHMVADVPVGALLSGGIDSSIVVASTPSSVGSLRTFSVAFDDPRFDESRYAQSVARRFDTTHTTVTVRADAAADVDTLAEFYDEPFADPSAVPMLALAKSARQDVKVALSGDGGDEAFGGYARYAHDLWEAGWRNRVPRWVRHHAVAPLGRAWPATPWLPRPLRARTFLTNIGLEAAGAYANSTAICRPPRLRRVMAAGLAASLNGHDAGELIRAGFAGGQSSGVLHGMLAADVEVLLPDNYLVKVDRASMARGLEVRPPLLDHHVLELAAAIPADLKVRPDGQLKWILRQAYQDRLPPEILNRRKHGFDVPLDDWFRGPLARTYQERVLSPGAPIERLVDQRESAALLREHRSGIGRHGAVLWSVLVLAAWAERYL
jgi:asparagine synthase (glutamine-hydrolysing)